MPTEPEFLLLKPTHYPKAEDFPRLLGCVVRNYYTPETHRTPKNPAFFCDKNYLESDVLVNVEFSSKHSKRTALSAALQSLLHAERQKETSGHFDFSAKIIRSIRLVDHDEIWDLLKEDEEVKTKLQTWIGGLSGGEAYFITGLLTFQDANLDTESSETLESQIKVEAPIKQTLGTALGLPTTDNSGNPSVERTAKQSASQTLSGINSGKHVFAIEYKVVRRKPFATAQLTDNNPRYVKGQSFAGDEDQPAEETEFDLDDFRISPINWASALENGSLKSVRESDEFELLYEEEEKFVGADVGVAGAG